VTDCNSKLRLKLEVQTVAKMGHRKYQYWPTVFLMSFHRSHALMLNVMNVTECNPIVQGFAVCGQMNCLMWHSYSFVSTVSQNTPILTTSLEKFLSVLMESVNLMPI
jgi:hypothetical protein